MNLTKAIFRILFFGALESIPRANLRYASFFKPGPLGTFRAQLWTTTGPTIAKQ
jgi:hypothetical protein